MAGKALFPGAAFFEMAAAASTVLKTAGVANLALASVTIPAPLQLPAASRKATALTVFCNVDGATGVVEISSTQRAVHLHARLAATSEVNTPTAALPSPTVIFSTQQMPDPAQSYTANIDASGSDPGRDTFLSPAVLDCCLHLGAVQPADGPSALKVPAAVRAVAIPAITASLDYWAAAALNVNSPALALTDYALVAAAGPTACSIDTLEARPLSAVSSEKAAAAAEDILYGICWAAYESAISGLSSGRPQPVIINTAVSAGALCSAGIQLLQGGGLSSLETGLQLQTVSTQPFMAAGRGSTTSAGLLWGLLRTAALEKPGLPVTALDVDPLSCGSDSQHAAISIRDMPQRGDAYGSAARSGVLQRATLVPTSELRTGLPSRMALKSPSHSGRVVITGGTGSLGSIIAVWAEAAGSAGGLDLIGRTGKLLAGSASLLAALVSTSQLPVSLTMADVAASEDSAGVFNSEQQLVSTIMHSGGVLADAVVSNQHPAGIRAVFAGKTVAPSHWRSPMTRQPTAAEVLFSSVASLLGSAGQANYSAANALLDLQASSLQQQVCRQ